MEEEYIDRGENKTVFVRSHSDIREGGKKMCEKHSFKKLSDNEVYCTQCPTAVIVNPEVIDELCQ